MEDIAAGFPGLSELPGLPKKDPAYAVLLPGIRIILRNCCTHRADSWDCTRIRRGICADMTEADAALMPVHSGVKPVRSDSVVLFYRICYTETTVASKSPVCIICRVIRQLADRSMHSFMQMLRC